MIRRRNIQSQEQCRDRNEHSKESHQLRKEHCKMGNRFNYQLLGYRANENVNLNDSADGKQRVRQECDDSFPKEVMNKTLVKSIKYCGLKKEHLYEDVDNERCDGKISLHRSRNLTMRYEKNNTSLFSQGDDIKNTSFQYFPQSLMPTTMAYRTGFIVQQSSKPKNRSSKKKECLNTEEDLQMKYQQLWQKNQREKQRHTQKLFDNHGSEHLVINTKHSNSKHKREERSFSTKQEQPISAAAITHRDYNRVSNPKAEHFNCMQTRKTSPNRFHNSRAKNIQEEITLRCSPVKQMTNHQILKCPTTRFTSNLPPEQIQANLKLIEQFSSRISLKIQELTASLLPLRIQR